MKFDLSFITRKKVYDATNVQETKLSRVLGLVDLVALGVSCTLGSGVYVLVGDVVGLFAGPSIVFSFIVAGLATFIAGMCYAEFGARVPRSGSAYVYIYVTIGELIAFILGWDLILEYVIGLSSTASALTQYIDSFVNNKISDTLRSAMPMNVTGLGEYPDFLSLAFILLITVLMCFGVRESSFLNKIFTLLNLAVIAFIFFTGISRANVNYWKIKITPNISWVDVDGNNQTCATSDRCGDGGFMPFGFYSIIKGAARCFFAYIGFDAIASTGEEVQNPKRNIPLSVIFTLLIVSASYISVSMVITLMIPYYMLDTDVPLPQAFNYVHLNWATPIASVGAIASLITCMYASMFPMPRVVYSLASDGLIFKVLAYIFPRFKTPVLATIVSGLFAGILSLIFNLDQLIDMMSIGTLLAYSVVAVCVILLRYRPAEISKEESSVTLGEVKESFKFLSNKDSLFKKLINPSTKKATKETSLIVNVVTCIGVLDAFFISLFLTFLHNYPEYLYVFLSLAILFAIKLIIVCIIIARQPQDKSTDSFKIPFVPFTPYISVIINLYLMMALNYLTWIRFGVWFILGMIMYFCYGIRHSTLAKNSFLF